MNRDDSPVSEDDFRNVVRILADIATMEGTLDEKRVRLMSETASLIGAEAWLWGFSPLLVPGKQPVYLFLNHGGFDEQRLGRLIEAVEHPDTGAMTAPLARAMIESGGHVTRCRQDIVPNERYLASPALPLWRAADVGPLVLSTRPLVDKGTSVSAFYRRVSAPLFSARESRIAHILLTEVPWLHEASTPSSEVHEIPILAPRCRLILQQIVFGRVRKDIAADLGLSRHTVNDYVKQIFRHFGVQSQVQLVARLRNGDGNDCAVSGEGT